MEFLNKMPCLGHRRYRLEPSGNLSLLCILFVKFQGVVTLPETNSKSPWKLLVRRWNPILLGMATFQGGIVNFREGMLLEIHSFETMSPRHQVTCWSLLASKGLTRKSRLRSGFMMRLVFRSGSQFGATYLGLKSAHRGFGCLNPYRFVLDFSTTLILLICFLS